MVVSHSGSKMTEPSIEESVLKYENFINDVLKEDLRKLEQRLIQVNGEISDLIQQRHTLKVITDKKNHPKGFKTQMNLGCNFFMEAEVSDTSKMLINVGLNHYVEFTELEANKFLDALIKAYESKAEELHTKVVETHAHIKMMLIGVDALINPSSA